MQKGQVDLLIVGVAIVIILILIIPILGDFYQAKFSEVKKSVTQVLTVSSPIPWTPQPTPTPVVSVDNLVTYEIPDGWRKEVSGRSSAVYSENVVLMSSEYQTPAPMFVEHGASISLSYLVTTYDTVDALENIVNDDSLPYNYDKKSLTIGGKQAISFHEDYEGHHLFYNIADNSRLWQIAVTTPNLEVENSFRPQIEAFISSIKFKE